MEQDALVSVHVEKELFSNLFEGFRLRIQLYSDLNSLGLGA